MITCKNCGGLYSETDGTRMYYFESATKKVGSYTSPAEIMSLGESITFCPRCMDKSMQRLTEVLNDDRPGTGNPAERYDPDDREHASQGKANVVHRPII